MKLRFDTGDLEEHLKKLKKARQMVGRETRRWLNTITDRHISRCVANTPVGDSPDSPSLRNRWDRSGVVKIGDAVNAEVFNPLEYASYFEYGHRQTPGRLVFIELTPGARKYGQVARKMKNGKWGIFIRLKKPYVQGRYVLTNSETIAQRELNYAAIWVLRKVKEALS